MAARKEKEKEKEEDEEEGEAAAHSVHPSGHARLSLSLSVCVCVCVCVFENTRHDDCGKVHRHATYAERLSEGKCARGQGGGEPEEGCTRDGARECAATRGMRKGRWASQGYRMQCQ